MKTLNNISKHQLFSILGFLILGLEFLAIILAIVNLFYWPILACYIFLGTVFFIFLVFHNYKNLKSPSILIAAFIILLAISILSQTTEPTVFSGRDQGSFSEAAIRLSQNHKLSFETTASQEFFKIYGPGTALNFPGFNYTQNGQLTTQFSLGYTAWLATFYSLFGLTGFVIANSITLFLFLFSLFLLTKINSNSKTGFLAIFILLSSFVFSWLFKFTLSENLALGIIWFGILELNLFLKLKKEIYFLGAMTSFLILAFTRIEAWGMLLMLLLVFFILKKTNKTVASKALLKKIIWLIGGFAIIFIANIYVNNQFYLASLKGLIRSFSSTGSSSVLFSTTNYLIKIFSIYNIIPFFFIGVIGIVYFLIKKRYLLLMPCFIILPTFIYLSHPGISLDHPWMLRRFAFTLIPGAIFYSALIINHIFTRKFSFYLFSLILIGTNLVVALPYFDFKENKNLLTQIKPLSENFSSTDLVLVDRLASGDGWSMISGPLSFLYGKQAVYFFNPKDLAKIDTSKFSNVFLIIPNKNLPFYEKDDFLKMFTAQKDYTIKRSYLDTFDPEKVKNISLKLPQKTETITEGKIYLLNN
ncbi:MAG: hypothetical protein WAV31_02765 [Candidatus Moraniibacteriota bacterium]